MSDRWLNFAEHLGAVFIPSLFTPVLRPVNGEVSFGYHFVYNCTLSTYKVHQLFLIAYSLEVWTCDRTMLPAAMVTLSPLWVVGLSHKFHCNLCEYKSCIQAKVKRHLRNVHKCPMDEMTYNPVPDIRLKVIDMKMQCFPKMDEAMDFRTNATSSPLDSSYASPAVGKCKVVSADEAGSQSTCDKPCTSDSEDSLQKLTDGMESISSLMNSMLGTSDLDLDDSGHKGEMSKDENSAAAISKIPLICFPLL
ncbi:unnamed protein product [Soboliphyme baturini]|uniref:C2H2-type domain-containing protein n=1 Tax=Soboliphyme baturini TaxID=241478 RepID=A0A183JB75_9BILA|nr:unnamed protein product [Soboliphyme baturini]